MQDETRVTKDDVSVMDSEEGDAKREGSISAPMSVTVDGEKSETMECSRSGNSAVKVESGLSNDDELWVDQESQVGQLVSDLAE